MKEKSNIIELTKNVVDNISNLDDWIDDHLEEVKDYTDTASDVISPVRTFIKIVNFVKSRKFKRFLKSYAKEIKRKNDIISPEFSNQLRKYLERPANLNMIYESIDSSIRSNSIYSSSCIGFIAGKQMANLCETNNKVLILINAFKNLNDFELYSAARILDEVKDYTKTYDIRQMNVVSIGTPSEFTVNKLKNLQVVDTRDTRGNTFLGYFEPDHFQISEITEEFISIIKSSGVYDQMIKDFT